MLWLKCLIVVFVQIITNRYFVLMQFPALPNFLRKPRAEFFGPYRTYLKHFPVEGDVQTQSGYLSSAAAA